MGSAPSPAPQTIQIGIIEPVVLPVEQPKVVMGGCSVEQLSTQKGTVELDQRKSLQSKSVKAKIKEAKKPSERKQLMSLNPEQVVAMSPQVRPGFQLSVQDLQ